jgi:hypothetical protein
VLRAESVRCSNVELSLRVGTTRAVIATPAATAILLNEILMDTLSDGIRSPRRLMVVIATGSDHLFSKL